MHISNRTAVITAEYDINVHKYNELHTMGMRMMCEFVCFDKRNNRSIGIGTKAYR